MPAAAATTPAATAAAIFLARDDFLSLAIAFFTAALVCRPIAEAFAPARCIADLRLATRLLAAGVALATRPFFFVPFRTTARAARATLPSSCWFQRIVPSSGSLRNASRPARLARRERSRTLPMLPGVFPPH